MSSIKRRLSKLKAWVTRKDPPAGPGPGGSPDSQSYEDARAVGEFHRFNGFR